MVFAAADAAVLIAATKEVAYDYVPAAGNATED